MKSTDVIGHPGERRLHCRQTATRRPHRRPHRHTAARVVAIAEPARTPALTPTDLPPSPATPSPPDSSVRVRSVHELFRRLAHSTAYIIGTPAAFMVAIGSLVIWALTGPAFGYSDTWQLIINTGTTIVTFLVVFMIQNTQNRDSQAIHVKLDELIRATKTARNTIINIEDVPDAELARLRREMRDVCTERSEPLS
jgi:low affinity Fe/Cu permease